jgi:diguanylate cyclase (GGDEF)-like protein
VIALANSRTDQAAVTAERIKRAVAVRAIRHDRAEVRLTVSIGLAAHRGATSLAKLTEQADAALYRAKAAGRNRVELAPTLVVATVQPAESHEQRKSRAA